MSAADPQTKAWAAIPPRRPWVCPVCQGKGIVPQGFYHTLGETWGSTSTAPEQCRACNGSGVVRA